MVIIKKKLCHQHIVLVAVQSIDFSEEIINTIESGSDGSKKLVQKLNDDS